MDETTIEEFTNDNKRVSILTYRGDGDPVRALDNKIREYTNGEEYWEFINANMSDPWTRIIVFGEKNKKKRRKFEVKLESIDPIGTVIESKELSMMIVDDEESMINNGRLFIHIGECLYRVDKRGFIIDRIIPHEK